MANYEVETQLSVVKGATRLIFNHPQDGYEIHIRDLATDPGTIPPLLSVQVILDAQDLEDAKIQSKRILDEFLHILSFVTNGAFKVHRIAHVFDWTEGRTERACIYFHVLPADEFPFPTLSAAHIDSASSIAGYKAEVRLTRARKWFANALSATYLDDKFTFFWFAIELCAQLLRDPSKVPDRCPRCREPLWCGKCEEVPLHRPYPKQAIEHLFHQFINGERTGFYSKASEARNRLLHGDEIEAIEQALDLEFSQLVDDIGKLAWTALLNLHKGAFEDNPRPEFQIVSRYTQMQIEAGGHFIVGYPGNIAEPTPEDAPKISMTVHVSDEQE